jgi:amphi-Trp domain-containing protein
MWNAYRARPLGGLATIDQLASPLRNVKSWPSSRRCGYALGMSDRDIEKNVPTEYFVAVLRRLADALERGEAFRIQVQNKRFVVPQGAELIVEHEVEGGCEELSLELKWKNG